MTTGLIKLRSYQIEALAKLKTGSILRGGVGSGKTITSLAYFYTKVCGGSMGIVKGDSWSPPTTSLNLYVITTARKRDSLDWESEAAYFGISKHVDSGVPGIRLIVDSWNNIKKYLDVTDSFFIFDEQKTIGSGAWAKAFIKIAKVNKWIMLSATPGDTWMDYVSVFVANGFYKNRTAFIREHVVYSNYANFPKIERYLGLDKLKRLRDQILVEMNYKRKTVSHNIDIFVQYDETMMETVVKDRWNVFKNKPIINAAELCYVMRQVANSHPDRLRVVKELAEKHQRIIVFYNFDYELEILRTLKNTSFDFAEYNGHNHQDIPESQKWVYAVQYLSAAEAWNCIETNAIVFYSLNYSYRLTTQSAGRIDRMNTPFYNLYYYFIRSESVIDKGIVTALKKKTNFNEKTFLRNNKVYF